jgi:hypothetical protein
MLRGGRVRGRCGLGGCRGGAGNFWGREFFRGEVGAGPGALGATDVPRRGGMGGPCGVRAGGWGGRGQRFARIPEGDSLLFLGDLLAVPCEEGA